MKTQKQIFYISLLLSLLLGVALYFVDCAKIEGILIGVFTGFIVSATISVVTHMDMRSKYIKGFYYDFALVYLKLFQLDGTVDLIQQKVSQKEIEQKTNLRDIENQLNSAMKLFTDLDNDRKRWFDNRYKSLWFGSKLSDNFATVIDSQYYVEVQQAIWRTYKLTIGSSIELLTLESANTVDKSITTLDNENSDLSESVNKIKEPLSKLQCEIYDCMCRVDKMQRISQKKWSDVDKIVKETIKTLCIE